MGSTFQEPQIETSTEEKEVYFKLDKKDLECPVCLELPDSLPIYQCLQGHIICNSCQANLKNCPVCRVALEPPIRALMEEKILRKKMKVCKYEGCSKLVRGNIAEHEELCEFALVNCTVCQENVTLRDLDEHERNCGKKTKPIVKRKKTRRRPKRCFSSWPIG